MQLAQVYKLQHGSFQILWRGLLKGAKYMEVRISVSFWFSNYSAVVGLQIVSALEVLRTLKM